MLRRYSMDGEWAMELPEPWRVTGRLSANI
ncbi:hypothetical protein BH24ACT15_BH24ACT15_35570 [soil metagenome]